MSARASKVVQENDAAEELAAKAYIGGSDGPTPGGKGESMDGVAEVADDYSTLLDLVRVRALRKGGPYRLRSGKTSSYFLDMKAHVLNDAETLGLVARLILRRIPQEATAVGGRATGSIPISTSIIWLNRALNPQRPLHGFWVREDEKAHGLREKLSGTLGSADKVTIVDDVTTEGNSILEALEEVERTGATVLKVITVVDREQGARRKFEARSIPFEAILTSSQVLRE